MPAEPVAVNSAARCAFSRCYAGVAGAAARRGALEMSARDHARNGMNAGMVEKWKAGSVRIRKKKVAEYGWRGMLS